MEKLIFSGLVFCVYGSFCVISLILVFSVETYKKIDEVLCCTLFSAGSSNPLDINIRLDHYFMEYNKIVGTVLFLLSLTDIKLALDFLSML